MISYSNAIEIINTIEPAVQIETIPLATATGRILAKDIHSRTALPYFSNSAVEGYALKHADVGLFQKWQVQEPAAAGEDTPPYIAGTVLKVMADGRVPLWADTVVPHEGVKQEGGQIYFQTPPTKGANLHLVGEDLQKNCLVLKSGARFNPERLMVTAACGHTAVDVYTKPKIAVLANREEMTKISQGLYLDTDYNSSLCFLAAACAKLGLELEVIDTHMGGSANTDALIASLMADSRPTLFFSLSASPSDNLAFSPKKLTQLGFDMRFDQVAVNPGQPIYLATHKQHLWLGLSKNVIATCVGWHFFARPLLTSWALIPSPRKRTVRLQNEVRKPEQLRCFYRAETNDNRAWVALNQQPTHLAASISADAYVELPEGQTRFPADAKVKAVFINE